MFVEKYEGCFDVEGGNFQDAGQASSRIKYILKILGCSNEIVRRSAIAAYEAEINVVSYARKGQIHLFAKRNSVMIDINDEGPGIADIDLAMQEGYSTATDLIRKMGFGAGMGLSNMKKCSDSFEITSTVDVGTRVIMKINHSE